METTRSTPAPQPGYYQPGPALRLARIGLRSAQALAPALAVRAAVRLFGTPLPPKWRQRGGAWAAHWRIERWLFESTAITLYLGAPSAGGSIALLAHGWGGSARQMTPLAETLARRGFQPVILEMPAHGRSPGSSSNLPQFARAIEYVIGRLQQQGHVIGALVAHSLGASAAAYAVSRGAAVERLALLAPAASPSRFTRYFAQVFGLTESTRAAMQERIEVREAVLMRHFEPGFVAPRVQVPTLVVHDRSDRVNAFADGQAYAAAIEDAQLLATDGLGHRRMLSAPSVLDQVAEFLTRENSGPKP